jgi:glutamate--cysteine ligase
MTTSIPPKKISPTIESRDQLIDSFARGEKPIADWRIGTEHEKFVYALSDHHAPSYDEKGGIRDLLRRWRAMAGSR